MRKFTAMLLCIIMMAVSIPLGTFTVAAEDVESVSEDDPVYYSDIFYAYSDYLNRSQYINTYISETQGIFYTVYEDFYDSPEFVFMDIKYALQNAGNIVNFVRIIGDFLGVSDYTYENTLDKANQLLDTSVLKTAQIAQSDINCDSEIDVRDLVHLKKQLVKWA